MDESQTLEEVKKELLKELHDEIYNNKCNIKSWDSYTAKEICLIIANKLTSHNKNTQEENTK